MDAFENILTKFQDELGALIDDYAQQLSKAEPTDFHGDEEEWGNAHLILIHAGRDFMEANFHLITEGKLTMAPFNPEDFDDGDADGR